MSTTIRWPDGAKFGRGLHQDHDVKLLMTSAEATAASHPAAPPAATAPPPLTGSAASGGGVSNATVQQQQLQLQQPTTMNAQNQLPPEGPPRPLKVQPSPQIMASARGVQIHHQPLSLAAPVVPLRGFPAVPPDLS